MTLTLAILGLLAAFAPLAAGWLLRRLNQRQTPEFKHEDQSRKDDAAIAAGQDGVDDLNRRLAELDVRLHGAEGDRPAK